MVDVNQNCLVEISMMKMMMMMTLWGDLNSGRVVNRLVMMGDGIVVGVGVGNRIWYWALGY